MDFLQDELIKGHKKNVEHPSDQEVSLLGVESLVFQMSPSMFLAFKVICHDLHSTSNIILLQFSALLFLSKCRL